MDRSVRTFIAVVLWLLAGLIATNNIVAQQTELDNWWLPLLLFIAGVALVLIPDGWSWRGVSHEEEAEADAAIVALQPPAAAPALPRLLELIKSIVQILSGIVPAMGGRPLWLIAMEPWPAQGALGRRQDGG